MRGLAGLGDYILREGLTPQPLTGNTLPAVSAANIVDSVRNATAVPVNSSNMQVSQTPSPSGSSMSSSIEPTCSTSADTQDVEPDSPRSTTCNIDYSLATTYERGAAVIATDKISLNAKLAVFTVVGTTEPRVVKLFPTATCSCPSQSHCYHILAARMAVGFTEKPKTRQLNLTKLRKNARKRPDKTSGRKRPRMQDVIVVGADDLDESMAAAITADTPASSATDETANNCRVCQSADPPADKIGRAKAVRWVGCDGCPLWFHNVCVGVCTAKGNVQYTCDTCKNS